MAMRNVKIEQKGRKLHVILDLDAEAPLSKSQLSYLLSSTGGHQVVIPGHKLNLSLCKDRDDLSEGDRQALRTQAKADRVGK